MAMSFSLKTIVASAMFGLAGFAIAHGNVTPQEVDTGNLPELGDDVRIETPSVKAVSSASSTPRPSKLARVPMPATVPPAMASGRCLGA